MSGGHTSPLIERTSRHRQGLQTPSDKVEARALSPALTSRSRDHKHQLMHTMMRESIRGPGAWHDSEVQLC